MHLSFAVAPALSSEFYCGYPLTVLKWYCLFSPFALRNMRSLEDCAWLLNALSRLDTWARKGETVQVNRSISLRVLVAGYCLFFFHSRFLFAGRG